MKRLSAVILCCFAVVASLASPAFGAPGDLDTSFSGDGKVTTNFTRGNEFAYAVAIQADGKIVAAGRVPGGGGRFALVRYSTDGTLDPTFSGDGKITANFTAGDDFATGVLVQPDGKIVAAGHAAGRNHKFALVRYNTDGTLDTAFSSDGKLVTDFTSRDDFAWDVSIQTDGKIVAAGVAATGSGGRFAIARYNPDGTLDTTFSSDGKVRTNLTARHDAATALAIQADGKIVAAGAANNDAFFALVRYNVDGTLDSTFEGDGTVVTDFTFGHDFAWDVALQSDGRIVATGIVAGSAGRFGLARYTPEGTLDTGFGGDGRVTTNFSRRFDGATALAIQADGKIVAAGSANDNAFFAVARYNVDGTLDTGFGGDGRVSTNITGGFDFAWDMSLQADGKIVAAGGAGGSGGRFAVARYMGG